MNCRLAQSASRLPATFAILGMAALSSVLSASTASALEEGAGETKAIDACDKRLCDILQHRDTKGDDLKCALTKTWAKSTLKEADQRDVKWGFGDARCTVHININRGAIISAINGGDAKFWVPPHTANCVIEQDGQLKNLTATLAPKIVFKDGKASKVWINLLNIEGPAAIKGTLATAAQLEDSIGIFHRAMLKSVNGYIYKHCPKHYPLTQASTAPAPAKPAASKPTKHEGPTIPKKQGG